MMENGTTSSGTTKQFYKVHGTGKYFQDFWIQATDIWHASAAASDILAGADRNGKRFYRTVEREIVSITAVAAIPDDEFEFVKRGRLSR